MADTNTRTIAILPADTTRIKAYFENEDIKREDPDNNIYWIYLGKNFSLSLSLNDLIGMRAQRLDIAESLQTAASATRQEYIDYIGRLGSSERNRYWWLTSISEKNPFISNIFLYSCYLNVIADLYLKKTYQNLVVICESPALMTAIDNFLRDKQDIQVYYHPYPDFTKTIKNRIIWMKSTAIFVLRWTIRCILAHIFGLIRDNKRNENREQGKKIIIHSWVDNRSFRTPGQYEDVFFGRLGSDLKKVHSGVYYLIDVLPTCFFPVALSKLFGTGEDFILMEEFINPLDVVLSVHSVSRHFPDLKEIPRFMNLDITPIIHEELEKDRINLRTFQTNLFYIVGREIAKKYEVQSFIYSFENLMWEKMFCLSFRKFSPSTKIIGYAHSTISKMEIFYSVSAYERDFIPLPDTVVVNGLRAQEALINSGFDRHRIVIGGAYRYHSLEIDSTLNPKNKGIKNILIIPTDDFNSTLELVTKTMEAFGNKKEIKCIIKLHPTLPRRKISAYLSRIPDNFVISENSINQLLSCVDLVVYTGSTVAIEAIAQGIPILHVRSDLTIDRDIFSESDHIVSVSRPGEIYQAFLTILEGGIESHKKGQEIVQEFFAPVDESTIQVFLGENH
jgi:hypothetical protein